MPKNAKGFGNGDAQNAVTRNSYLYLRCKGLARKETNCEVGGINNNTDKDDVLMSCRVNFHVVRSALQYSACRI